MIKKYGGYEAKKSGGAREILPAGGYVGRIISAKVDETKFGDRLVVAFDIDEGNYKGFFKRDFDNNNSEDKKWRGVMRLNIPADDGSEYDEFRKRSFNNFAFALEDSNNGYTFDWDESKLKDKLFGVLFRNKEWAFAGKSGWTTEACGAVDVKSIREGKFRVPKDKPLDGGRMSASATPAEDAAADESLPF